jgi:uncharacterized protein (DUF305 family)
MTSRLWVIIAVVGVVALGAGLGIGAAAWGGDDGGEGMAMGSAAMEDMGHGSDSVDADSGTLDEQSFMEQMVPHHESAVAMASLALEKATRPEIRRLAEEIVSAQESEIARMGAWHESWFGEELMADMDGPHGSMDMGALEDAEGDEFDLAFLSMMIPHHASAITMAKAAMEGSPREELMMLAEEIIAAQAGEIGQMQRWREQWFPRG